MGNKHTEKATSVIEIDGKRYDAGTGQIISAIKTAKRVKNQVIDGFIKGPSAVKVTASLGIAKAVDGSRKGVAQSRQHHPARKGAKNLHRQTDRAHTLMRAGLKKPAVDLRPHLQRIAGGLRPETEVRAKQTTKHAKVNRFGIPTAQPDSGFRQAVSGEVINYGAHSGQARKANGAAAPIMPSMITSVSHQKLERMLDKALSQADAHKQALRYQSARHFWQKSRFWGPRRWLAFSFVLIVVIAALGLLAWQKVPQLSVKVAATRAHIPASVPAYKPAGYGLAAPASISGGAVMLKYQSATDSTRGFDILQQQSSLNSNSLAHTVIPAGTQVQTSQVDGNTVYIYGPGNDAAWVNNGMLYMIKNHTDLSSDELLKIAQGL